MSKVTGRPLKTTSELALPAFIAALCISTHGCTVSSEGTSVERIQESLRLPAGWEIVDSLDVPYSLVFRHDGDLMSLEIDEPQPRPIPTTQTHGFYGTPTWSRDGRYMLDCEVQVISIATDSGAVRVMTSIPLQPTGPFHPKVWPTKLLPSGSNRFVEDSATNRLYFVTHPPPELVAMDLSSSHPRTVLTKSDVGGDFLAWALDPDTERFYAALDDRIVARSLDGRLISQFPTDPEKARHLQLSPDRAMLLAEKFRKQGDNYEWDLGCWFLDAASLELKNQILRGHDFRWSADGRQVAFLIEANELWLYDVDKRTSSRLASLLPPADAPSWSRSRYYAEPAWSHDSRMLACALSIYTGPGYHRFHRATLIMDLHERRARIIPENWGYFSWSPIRKPFSKGEGK